MTRSPVAVLSGLCLAVLMTSCAGSGQGVNTAADAAAASAAQHSSAPDVGTGPGDVGSTAARPTGGKPGGPGGDPAGAGGDVGAQGNPGAPGDVAVFEEAGVPHSVLRNDAATKCAGGVCTLREPKVGAGNPDDVGGVDECLIRAQSDIRYDPPAEGGLFRKGATVQATVDCTVQNSGNGDTQTAAGTQSDGSQSASSATTTSTAADQAPAGQPQG